jgi:hypothetical protein
MQFEAHIDNANARLRALQACDRDVDPLEYYSGVFKPAGEDHHQRPRRIAQAAIEHGARPPAEVVSELRELGDQISQSRSETPDVDAATSRPQGGTRVHLSNICRGAQMTSMSAANPVRIPGSADTQAAQVLDRTPEVVDSLFLRTVDKNARIALGRYGVRAVTLAVRNRDARLLRRALLASSIAAVASDDDPRDTMVTVALHHFAAQQLNVRAAPLFDRVADRVGNRRVAALLREFGSRSDVTLDLFGWKLVETADGVDFEPS